MLPQLWYRTTHTDAKIDASYVPRFKVERWSFTLHLCSSFRCHAEPSGTPRHFTLHFSKIRGRGRSYKMMKNWNTLDHSGGKSNLRKSMAASINRPVASGVFRNQWVSIAGFRKRLVASRRQTASFSVTTKILLFGRFAFWWVEIVDGSMIYSFNASKPNWLNDKKKLKRQIRRPFSRAATRRFRKTAFKTRWLRKTPPSNSRLTLLTIVSDVYLIGYE